VTPLEGRRPKLRTVLLAGAGAVIVAVTLFRVPLATVFTLGVLLICPLLMAGMHGGRHGAGHNSADEVQADPTARTGEEGRSARTLPSPPHELGLGRNATHRRREVPRGTPGSTGEDLGTRSTSRSPTPRSPGPVVPRVARPSRRGR
jgi:hypothetical protein